MLLSEPLASPPKGQKFYHNSQRMSDTFYHILRIKLKNKGPTHIHLAM